VAGGTQTSATSFPCPRDSQTQLLGKIFGANRGSTFCNDGATAMAVIGTAKPKFANPGGVCWNGSDGFTVGIGT
jgi:hypothetical protein